MSTRIPSYAHRSRWRRAALAAGLSGALVLAVTTTAAAEPEDQAPPSEPAGGVSEEMRRRSVIRFDPAGSIRAFAPAVTALGHDPQTEDGQTTISLSTDLLFPENTWELPPSAPGRIASLVADVPDGATVQVVGHTDTQQPIGHDFDNQELSENRAEAVAAALRAERPDLNLDVSGAGDTEPLEDGDTEDPATHAANRRVEIVYPG